MTTIFWCFYSAARGRGRARGGSTRGWTPGGGAQAPGRGRAAPQ